MCKFLEFGLKVLANKDNFAEGFVGLKVMCSLSSLQKLSIKVIIHGLVVTAEFYE